jgi:hypothetical protein
MLIPNCRAARRRCFSGTAAGRRRSAGAAKVRENSLCRRFAAPGSLNDLAGIDLDGGAPAFQAR